MKNSLNEIKINLSSNAYIPHEQLKDFIYNNYITCSNKRYNINGNSHIEKYPSSYINTSNNQIGQKNYRDLLNMSLKNKKIVVNKMGFIKRKEDINKIKNEKTYNSIISEKFIDFNKTEKIKKKSQIKSIEKDRNIIYINFPTQNISHRNKFNLTLDIDKNNINKDNNNNNLSNKAISLKNMKNKNISYEKKVNNTSINKYYDIKKHNSISFGEKIFKNVFNKFIKYLNKYCLQLLKNELYIFFNSLKLKLKNFNRNKRLSMSKIYYQNVYNKHNNKARLFKNIKSLTIDNSLNNNEYTIIIPNNNSSYENKKDGHIRTMTLSSNDFDKDKTKKNKLYNKYRFNNLMNRLSNKSYDNANILFNSKIGEINKLYKKSHRKLNNTQSFYSKEKKINKTNKISNRKNIYSRKIIYNTKGIIKKPNKIASINVNVKTPTEVMMTRTINDDKYFEKGDKKKLDKKNNFIINLCVKNVENNNEKKIPKRIHNANCNNNKKTKNDYMFKTIDDYYKQNNNEITNKNNDEKNDEDLFNNFERLNSVDLKNIFFFKFKNFRCLKKNMNDKKICNKEINKVSSVLSTTGTSEDKYSLEKFYFIKNGHKLKKQKKKNENYPNEY